MTARFTAIALAAGAFLAASQAGADRYGRGEDLLYRLPRQDEPALLVTWFFYALAAVFGGWALLRFKAHVDYPQRCGLVVPAGGMVMAAAFAALPWALGELAWVLSPPPVWRAE